jgi:hypothetical protein
MLEASIDNSKIIVISSFIKLTIEGAILKKFSFKAMVIVACKANLFKKLKFQNFKLINFFLIIGLWQPPLRIDCYYICVNTGSLKINFFSSSKI